MITTNTTRLCRGGSAGDWRLCWQRQPRLPDPSYASPALEVVIEDKSGAALAWNLCSFHRDRLCAVARRRDGPPE
jgi:hypothetical protein